MSSLSGKIADVPYEHLYAQQARSNVIEYAVDVVFVLTRLRPVLKHSSYVFTPYFVLRRTLWRLASTWPVCCILEQPDSGHDPHILEYVWNNTRIVINMYDGSLLVILCERLSILCRSALLRNTCFLVEEPISSFEILKTGGAAKPCCSTRHIEGEYPTPIRFCHCSKVSEVHHTEGLRALDRSDHDRLD